MLVHRLVRVFPHICDGHYPLCESIAATFRVANKRLEFMGRRCKASQVSPGYVIPAPSAHLLLDMVGKHSETDAAVCSHPGLTATVLWLCFTFSILVRAFDCSCPSHPPIQIHRECPRAAGHVYGLAAESGRLCPSFCRQRHLRLWPTTRPLPGAAKQEEAEKATLQGSEQRWMWAPLRWRGRRGGRAPCGLHV